MKKFWLLILIVLVLSGCQIKNPPKTTDVDSDALIQERIDELNNNNTSEEKVEEKTVTEVTEEKKSETKSETKTESKSTSDNKKSSDTKKNDSSNSTSKNTTGNNSSTNSKSSNSGNNDSSTSNNQDNKQSQSGNEKKPGESNTSPKNEETVTTEKKQKNNFVSYNGKLKVSGTSLVNQYGEPIQLKGVSSHGLQWFGDLVNESNLDILKNNWNSNVFRLAMYTVEGGYINNKSILDVLEKKIQMVIDRDMYVIIDWHILQDGNPNTYLSQSKEFFSYMSKKYGNVPNVIFEICNEPNGNVNWNNDIKPYAEQVISVIRNNSSNAVVLVGTGTWSQDILDPVNNRLSDSNVMYDVHFYAGTHTDWLRNKVNEAYSKGLPIFISEWGTSDASGNGGVYLTESQKWIDYLESKNISYVNWSLTNKSESSALMVSYCQTLTDNCLTESGKFVKKVIMQ